MFQWFAIALGAVAVLHFLVLPALARVVWRTPREVETITPADLGIVFRDAQIDTVGGKRLHAWYLPTTSGAPSVVLLHGWGANAQSLLPLAQRLHAEGIATLLVDARNHGRSDGDSFSSMVKFAEDLDSAIEWLKVQPEVAVERIAVLGHSVGAAATLLCASRRDDLSAVVSIAAFAHPGEVMASMMSHRGIPYRPIGWWILRHVEQVIGARFDAIAPLNTVARIRAPVLLIHGIDDRSVPVSNAHRIHERGNGNAQLLLVPGGHSAANALRSHGELLIDFLRGAQHRPRPL